MSIRDRWRGKGITFLVPFTPGLVADRDRLWAWLHPYWNDALPAVQIIIGQDPVHHLAEPGIPFSKAAAVNVAAEKATGDVFVIIDADAYVTAELIRYAVAEVRGARSTGRRLWFVPYRRFFRLSADATERVLASDPREPWHPDDPPLLTHLDVGQASRHSGHHFAAMIMVMPREAFEETGGLDPRFAGWGGEDISFMRAVDTIYGVHKTIDRSVFHLFHGTIGAGINRQWEGQTRRTPFTVLGARYLAAYGDRARMLRLIAEWKNPPSLEDPDVAI